MKIIIPLNPTRYQITCYVVEGNEIVTTYIANIKLLLQNTQSIFVKYPSIDTIVLMGDKKYTEVFAETFMKAFKQNAIKIVQKPILKRRPQR